MDALDKPAPLGPGTVKEIRRRMRHAGLKVDESHPLTMREAIIFIDAIESGEEGPIGSERKE